MQLTLATLMAVGSFNMPLLPQKLHPDNLAAAKIAAADELAVFESEVLLEGEGRRRLGSCAACTYRKDSAFESCGPSAFVNRKEACWFTSGLVAWVSDTGEACCGDFSDCCDLSGLSIALIVGIGIAILACCVCAFVGCCSMAQK